MKTNFTILLVAFSLLNVVCEDKPKFHVTQYACRIVPKDSLYFIRVTFSQTDTISGAIADGIVVNFEGMFHDYNQAIIRFDKNQIMPQSVGISKVTIQFPNGVIDSLKVRVDKKEGRLVLSSLLPA